MPDLPPVGSLWRHRETGERRFVIRYSWGAKSKEITQVAIAVSANDNWLGGYAVIPIADWLAWQAGAERIDREEA